MANPTHNADGSERAIWAASIAGGSAWRLVEGGAPELSPDGRTVLYVKDGQIYRVRVAQNVARDSMDRGLKPFIRQWGQQSSPRWSPDGSRVAFVSSRGNHSYIGIYDIRTAKSTTLLPASIATAVPRELISAKGGIVSNEFILREVWGFRAMGRTRAVDTLIKRVRVKLGDVGQKPRIIYTARGYGHYMILHASHRTPDYGENVTLLYISPLRCGPSTAFLL